MIEFIYRDIVQTLHYIPYGVVVGIPVAAIILCIINSVRRKRSMKEIHWIPGILFGIYLAVLIAITFLSREEGSRREVIDFELFSTWGINDRNNAFVIENILLFIPYGFLCCWCSEKKRGLFKCMFSGLVVSFSIECMQLFTGRGFFQIDDILTNILGTVAGCLAFRIFFRICQAFR